MPDLPDGPQLRAAAKEVTGADNREISGAPVIQISRRLWDCSVSVARAYLAAIPADDRQSVPSDPQPKQVGAAPEQRIGEAYLNSIEEGLRDCGCNDDAGGFCESWGCAQVGKLLAEVRHLRQQALTRERVAAAVGELRNRGHSFVWLNDELTDRLCRLLGVPEGE